MHPNSPSRTLIAMKSSSEMTVVQNVPSCLMEHTVHRFHQCNMLRHAGGSERFGLEINEAMSMEYMYAILSSLVVSRVQMGRNVCFWWSGAAVRFGFAAVVCRQPSKETFQV
jgi:hypothetical protein